MKKSGHLKVAVLPLVLLVFACQHFEPVETQTIGDSRCDLVSQRGYINILNINVLYDEINNRQKRFEYIADFAAANDVDLILLQEIIGGVFSGTENSAKDLRKILRDKHNLNYNLSTAWEVGEPETWSSANAILSRCEIKHSELQRLPFVVNERLFKGKEEKKMAASVQKVVSITQNVQMVNLEIPNRGKMNVYNTHLCARTDIDGRKKQLKAMLEYVNDMEVKMMAGNPSVIAGDFNFDRFDNQGAEKFLWEKIVSDGFIDAYAHYFINNSGRQETLDTLCENEDSADEHCTVGVSELNGHNARRVDYVFLKSRASVRSASVVFNTRVNENQPSVSDHAGVFISVELP